MPHLHDPAVRDSIRARVQKLTPTSTRKWGKMSIDQMLWHVNEVLRNSLGETTPKLMKVPLPRSLMKFLVINLPWPKGAPTAPDYIATGKRYDFETERAKCLRLIDDFTRRPIEAPNWGASPGAGQMSGSEWSRLQHKHIDHHLKQFGT
jgi:hypothetical protein